MAKEYLKINNQLVMVDGKLVQVPDADNLNDLVDENGTYATQNDSLADAIIELLVNGVIDGSPKGIYDDLTALQTAFPTGTSGVYLTKDNGHWYYWNRSEWTDGGVYQSPVGMMFKDYGFVESKTDFNAIRDLLNVANYKVVYFTIDGFLDPTNQIGTLGRYEAFLSGDSELYFRNADGVYHYIEDDTEQGYYVSKNN